MSPLRRITLITIVACAIVAGWTSAAAARPIGEQTVSSPVVTAGPHATSSDEGGRSALPFVLLAGAVVLVAFGTAGYAHRTRVSHRATA
jgi:hypothetical protein